MSPPLRCSPRCRCCARAVDSCTDCLAWGVTGSTGWLCEGCRRWRRSYPVGACAYCARRVPVDPRGGCRLCHRQRLLLADEQRVELAAAIDRDGHQLFFAEMFHLRGARRTRLPSPPPAVRAQRVRVRVVQLAAFDGFDRPPQPIRPRTCSRCGQRPVRSAWVAYCYPCSPGGPVVPPPCRRCGSTENFYSAGLCARCHLRAPQRVDSCRDCLAWGATRTNKWLCQGCVGWRRRWPATGTACRSCARPVAVNHRQLCRLCHNQRWLLAAASPRRRRGRTGGEFAQCGQQLFFADIAGRHEDCVSRRTALRQRPAPTPSPTAPAARLPHVQLVAFSVARDLQAVLRAGLEEPRDAALAAHLDQHVTDHACRHGWSRDMTNEARRGIRILLSLQDIPWAPIKASEVVQLSAVHGDARAVLDVLAAANMLDDDRPTAIETWFITKVAELPDPMVDELRLWFDVMLHGSPRPPRSRPRLPRTISLKLRWALPALHAWAVAGHRSLREITPDDILAVLPAGEPNRSSMAQGLRSIFRVLKAHKRVFTNPAGRVPVAKTGVTVPLPLPVSDIREALDPADPVRAALAALVAFHGLRAGQLRVLTLTDIRDGRLHFGERSLPLAEPVRARLRAYLDYRQAKWPNTANAYLFVHHQTANRTTPVLADWVTKRLGLSAQALREDRILHEAFATGGDTRRLCDLFGLSIPGASRYTDTLDFTDRPDSTQCLVTGSRTQAPR